MTESIFKGVRKIKLSDDTSTVNKYEDPDFDRSDDYEVESRTNSIIRQNFAPETEQWLCRQVNLELQSHRYYLSMSLYFDSCEVARPGFAKFFMDCAKEENEHAVDIGKYINKRGGRVELYDIEKPTVGWKTGLEAMEAAMELEKSLSEHLFKLGKVASKNADPDTERLVNDYICKQVRMIKKLGCHIVTLKKMRTPLGEHIFDQETLKGKLITDSDSSSSSSSSSSDSDSD